MCRCVLVGFLLALSACGRSQLELIPDARAGAQAYQQETDPVKREQIANGLATLVIAATENIPALPDPGMTVAEIRADPAEFVEQAQDAAEEPPPYEGMPVEAPRPSDQLTGIGSTMVTVGGWTGAIAIVLLLVSLTPWGAWLRIAGVASVIRLIASTGTGSALVGSAMVYLAPYWWLAVALVALGIGFYHRKGLMKYLKKIRGGE